MFGVFRFFLAWMVVLAHISSVLEHAGGFAVFSFYILSGYLMTLVMNEKYGYSVGGIKKFLLNRALRIFPSYWFLATITLFGIVLFPEPFYSMHNSFRVPEGLHEIFSNIFIFGLSPWIEKNGETVFMARLVPPAWALHVELCFYVLIGLFFGRVKALVWVWFACSVIYHVVALVYGYPRYVPVYAASLPFSIGALIYFYGRNVVEWIPMPNAWVGALLAAHLMYILVAGWLPFATDVYPAYLNILIAALLICQLSVLNARQYPVLGKVDGFLGDLSYPIYLGHWFVAVVSANILGIDKSLLLFFVSIPGVVLLSLMIKYVIDDPVERQRKAIASSLGNR